MIVWISTLLKASPSIFIAVLYGGIAILIFCVFLICTPYSYFKYQQEKDIEFEEAQKARYREQPIIEMPSSSIQIIKSITMDTNQSLSIKKLSISKRKKLDTFRILCFCGMTLQKGSPHSVYDDTHYDQSNKCYECYICHRLFDFETDCYLLFTCPQNIIPIHYNGFVICIYCVWTIYIYQKNIKYYKHFVHNINNESTFLNLDIFDDDDMDNISLSSHSCDSMDSYHQRINYNDKQNRRNTIKYEDENDVQSIDVDIDKKRKNRAKLKLIKNKIDLIKARKFSIATLWNEILPIKHIYIAVILYIIDTTTDISITVLWGKRAYREHIQGIELDEKDNVNIVGLFLTSITLLLFYRIVSCCVIYIKNYDKSWAKTRSLMQLFDLLLFWELYCSHFIGKKTENFLLISKMKALFESCPQSIIQTFIIVRSTLVNVDDKDNFILYLSLISAVISILHRFNLEDSYVFERSANKKWPPSIGYTIRTCFRIFEIVSRLLVFSLISTVIGERIAFIYAAIDILIMIRLHRKGLIGPSWMNVVGYMISVIDLASVPSVPVLYSSNNDPGDTNKLYSSFIFKLIQFISGLFQMIMGFWIPYVIGCCNKYLDHFGFVVITSRFYQHTVLLFIMCLMLVSQRPIILCKEPFCTSNAVRKEIRDVSIILIIVAFICTILSFVCYLIACKYLKIGVIATERNPWLAVRVGDIHDALMIFKENASDYNIKSHEWKRNVFWKKFISSKYSIPNIHDFNDKNLRALYRLLKTEDETNWDIPLIKDIAFDAVKIKFDDIFLVFFHPTLLSENEGISPLLNVYTCIDNKGNYILHEAAKSGSVEILYILLTRGRSSIPVLNKLNETPLHLACRGGNMTVIEMLLNAWSLTKMDKNGRYPCHYGIETANKEIVALMMKHINHLFECQYNDNNIWSEIVGSLLLSCAQNSNQAMFEYILKNKSPHIIPNINYKLSTSGLSCIHYAVLTRNINIVKILLNDNDLKRYININIGDNDNITPLMIAVDNDDVEMVDYLLQFDIDINIQTNMNGYTALHFAFSNGKYNKDIIFLLIKHPNIELLPDYNEETLLHLAALHKEILCVQILEIYTPSIHIINQQSLPHKNTVLHIAAMQNNTQLSQILLKLGADPYIENVENDTYYDIIGDLKPLRQKKDGLEEEIKYNDEGEGAKGEIKKRLVKMQLKYKSEHKIKQIIKKEEIKSVATNNIGIESEKKLREKCIEYYWRAIENNDYEITRILLQHKTISVDTFVRNGRFVGQTALHIVCTLGHYETLNVLMNLNATVNIQSKIDSATPLLLAVRFNHIECVSYLLNCNQSKHVIDVNIAALDETTPFYEACYSNNIELIRLLLQNPGLNIAQKTRNKAAIDIISDENTLIMIEEVLLNDKHPFIYRHNNDEHPFESQICKYVNIALEEHAIEIFNEFWNICVLPNLNNPTFLFLHVLCKEGHFNLLKYLITQSIEMDINWIVRDDHMMYPIQYLVEWFQFRNKQISNDSQWILSYILQRTFGCLMFNKMESFIWINCISKHITIDWNKEIKPPSYSSKNKEFKDIDIFYLKKKDLMCLNNIIISMFGLTNCEWNAMQCIDALNVSSYYDGIRRNERTYCFEYQLNDIQDITIYLDAMNNNTSPIFPINAFNALCTLILSDDIPLDQLQYLCDILRNLLWYPSIHPFITDLIFIEKMLSKICMEMEEYLMRDGSSLKNEMSVFMVEATAIAAVTNCYKYPTPISQHILDIVYPLLSHNKSPSIRLMTAKLLYNISLQIKMNIQSKLYTKQLSNDFEPQQQHNVSLEYIHEEKEDDDISNDSEDEDIYGQYVGIDEDELKMESELSNKNNKSNILELTKHINILSYQTQEKTIENIQNTLYQQICDVIIDGLNHENDVRVRSICLQTLALLITDNEHLIKYINDEDDDYIKHNIWKMRDYKCWVNRALYKNIMCLLPKCKPSPIVKLKSLSISGRRLNDKDIDKGLVKPIESLTKLQRLHHKQLSKALSSSALNYDEYYLDEFKFDQQQYDDDDDDNDDDDDEGDNNKLRTVIGEHIYSSTTTNNQQNNETNGARLKKIYSEGINIVNEYSDSDNDDHEMRETVLNTKTPNAPEIPFSKMLSAKTVKQISSDVTSTDTVIFINSHENHDEDVGFSVLGHARRDERVAFAFKHKKEDKDDEIIMLNKQFDDIINAFDSDEKGNNESDDDVLLNKITLME